MDNLWITRARAPAGPAAQTPNSPYIYFPVFRRSCELSYAPGAPGVECKSCRFFWEICWDTGLTTGAAGSINADAARSCRMGRKRDRIGIPYVNNTPEDRVCHLPVLDVYALNSPCYITSSCMGRGPLEVPAREPKLT